MGDLLSRLKRAGSRLAGSSPTHFPTPFEVRCDCGRISAGMRKATSQVLRCGNCGAQLYALPINVYPRTRRVFSEATGGQLGERMSAALNELSGSAHPSLIGEPSTQSPSPDAQSQQSPRPARRSSSAQQRAQVPGEALRGKRRPAKRPGPRAAPVDPHEPLVLEDLPPGSGDQDHWELDHVEFLDEERQVEMDLATTRPAPLVPVRQPDPVIDDSELEFVDEDEEAVEFVDDVEECVDDEGIDELEFIDDVPTGPSPTATPESMPARPAADSTPPASQPRARTPIGKQDADSTSQDVDGRGVRTRPARHQRPRRPEASPETRQRPRERPMPEPGAGKIAGERNQPVPDALAEATRIEQQIREKGSVPLRLTNRRRRRLFTPFRIIIVGIAVVVIATVWWTVRDRRIRDARLVLRQSMDDVHTALKDEDLISLETASRGVVQATAVVGTSDPEAAYFASLYREAVAVNHLSELDMVSELDAV
ncbi:MAG: hypothetical protein KDA96_24915, partial [Planctomycetaceae bacterium]|nr:hypothetical protein [Planctomycetaceae bacterium]